MILSIIEKPINKLALQEQVLQKYGQVTRKNVRRIHEIEYTVQKFQKVCEQAEQFENRFNGLDSKLHEQNRHFDTIMNDFNHRLTEDVPDAFAEQKRELDSWKRWFARIQRDCEEMSCLLYTSPSPRDATLSRMPSSA